jgi:hypothetical protein
MGAAARDHLAAILGGHALAKAVTALADEFARLIGALHDKSPEKAPNWPKEPCFYGAEMRLSTGAAGDAAAPVKLKRRQLMVAMAT